MLAGTNFIQRSLIRLFSLLIVFGAIYLSFFQVFPAFNDNFSLIVALIGTYLVSAYLLFPLWVRLWGWVSGHRKIPRYTSSSEGLPVDPINVIILGSSKQLFHAFADRGWRVADKITIRSAIKMLQALIFKRPYPAAPFSNLYLFGRKQDIGFQKCIGGSPRRRHHIRFWAYMDFRGDMLKKNIMHLYQAPNLKDARIWVGAGTLDTGLGYRNLTFQITHSVDKNADKERDFIVKDLSKNGQTKHVDYVGEHTLVRANHVYKFTTDGKVAILYLK